ncbi:MAG: restriction endonuclease subunit S [Candidatus Thiodiazotropha sp. (ex Troendleina suluensis)]|nr:restriction endonuclease subunit S [Candidatus Thiodiazotropha sp. (ex Troendleina suluensis)]
MSSEMEETVLNCDSPGESSDVARLCRIGDVVEKITGGCSTKKTDYISDGVLVLNKGHIKGYGIVDLGDHERFVSVKYANDNPTRVVKKDTVLVTLRDLSVKADFLGLIGTYKRHQDALITQGMYSLDLGEEIFAPYLVYYSNSPGYRAYVKRNKIGSTQVHLRNGQFLDIKIRRFQVITAI